MTEIMQGEMTIEAIVARRIVKIAMQAVSIKAVQVAAVRSVADGGAKATMCAAATVSAGANLGEKDGQRTRRGNGDGLPQINSRHSQAPRSPAWHYLLSGKPIRPSPRSNRQDS